MSIKQNITELKSFKLFDRKSALGEEMDRNLRELEKEEKILKKKKENFTQICLYCGEKETKDDFWKNHECRDPMIENIDNYPKPSRPIKIGETDGFEIQWLVNKITLRVFKFQNYKSAVLFRKLIWFEKKPILEALKNKKLKWL